MSKVTKEIVKKVLSYKADEKYSQLTYEELGLLCGTSATSISRIFRGDYNHLLKEDKALVEVDTGATTIIPLEDLKHLVACEYAVNTILKICKLSTNIDGALFIDYKSVFSILRAYVPDDVGTRLEELKRGENENE